MTQEEKLIKQASTQIGLAQEQILKGNVASALVMLDNAYKQVKAIGGTNEERLLDAVFERSKISITIPNDLLAKIKKRATKLQISVSTCITMLINGDIALEKGSN